MEKKMANVMIRNLDDEVIETLRMQAKAHHRSLEAELRRILTDAAKPAGAIDLRALAERIAAMSSAAGQTDSVELLHEDRGQ